MNKKNIATTIILILCSTLFTVTGYAFMTYVYEKYKITVENPSVISDAGVLVWNSEDESKQQLDKLVFNDIGLGLKPVTGGVSADSNIPSTVTDKHGSEGLYSSFKVSAPEGLTILIKNIKIEGYEELNEKEERENLFVALKDVEDSDSSLEEDVITLFTAKEKLVEQEFTLFFWIGDTAGEELKGAKISFDVYLIL